MKIHEYQGKEILREYGVAVPKGKACFSVDEAVAAAEEIGGSKWVVKAQIHAGGRGKGGGVKLADSIDEVRELAREARPRMIVAGASAYPRVLDYEAFRSIADEVGAILMVDMAHIAGLVATGNHPSPVPLAEFVTTTTHKTLRGPRAARKSSLAGDPGAG